MPLMIEVDVVFLALGIFLVAWIAWCLGHWFGWNRGVDHVLETLRKD